MTSKNVNALTSFEKDVYKFCKLIPAGKVSTYGGIAKAMGKPRSSRAVGSALKKNPFAPVVPCHRVVASTRKLGGFEGSTNMEGSNLSKKRMMLAKEGVLFEGLHSDSSLPSRDSTSSKSNKRKSAPDTSEELPTSKVINSRSTANKTSELHSQSSAQAHTRNGDLRVAEGSMFFFE